MHKHRYEIKAQTANAEHINNIVLVFCFFFWAKNSNKTTNNELSSELQANQESMEFSNLAHFVILKWEQFHSKMKN